MIILHFAMVKLLNSKLSLNYLQNMGKKKPKLKHNSIHTV